MIDVILFDVGGVLVELTGVDQMMTWTSHRHSVDALWDLWLASPAVRDFESGRIGSDTFSHRLVEEFDLSVDAGSLVASFDAWIDGPYPEVIPLLDRLRGRFKLGTLSNTNERHWPRFIDEMRMGPRFDVHFPSHQTGRLKPDSECFDYVVHQLGVGPDRILFLDDNETNVTAARASGLRSKRSVTAAGTVDCLESMGLLA